MDLSEFFGPDIVERIVRALFTAYEVNRVNFDPLIGHTPLSFSIDVWQSSLYFLEQSFGEVVGVAVDRRGNRFCIHFATCTLYFYKFGSHAEDDAGAWRLNSAKSATRKRIVETNHLMSLFNYTMGKDAQPVTVKELVVVHSGNPGAGLLQVHVGTPISSKRYEDGWLWRVPLYAAEAAIEEPLPPLPARFDQMDIPDIEVEARFDEMPETPEPEVESTDLHDDEENEGGDTDV
jgi:hypothetical protein